MTWNRVPVDGNGKDAYRRLAQAINYLLMQDAKITSLADYADDAAAAAGGVPVGGFYRNGSVVMVRVT
ncbi:hypothetical protein K7W03_14440 [Sphingobium sp. PNB]|uniref:hypothetical protein n=1 Tax=Sphingobium sp. PNB TaxID=863934 RepID=UPI001CA4223A|nr:hypothetical protein [Sphingobium sp. PNB]MCB4860790.1 hypothetical protein [Sphingobium sp. PNB]